MQLTRDFLEAVGLQKLGFQPLDLPTFGRVRTRLQGLTGGVTPAAGLLQGHCRVGTERQAFFLAGEVVLPEPALGSAGRNLQVETAGIGQPGTCLARRAYGGFAGDVGQHRGNNFGRMAKKGGLFP